MGKPIVYCGGCGNSLLEQDFEKGKAQTVDHQPFCSACRPIQKPLSSSSTTTRAAPPRSSTSRVPVVSLDTTRVQRAGTPRSNTIVFLAAGGGALLLALIGVAWTSGNRRSQARVEEEPRGTAPVGVERPP